MYSTADAFTSNVVAAILARLLRYSHAEQRGTRYTHVTSDCTATLNTTRVWWKLGSVMLSLSMPFSRRTEQHDCRRAATSPRATRSLQYLCVRCPMQLGCTKLRRPDYENERAEIYSNCHRVSVYYSAMFENKG